jgi:hypothetical protein
MRLDVMDDFSRAHKVNGKAPFTQRLAPKLVPPKPTPLSVVVGATSRVVASAAAAGMQIGVGIGAHLGTLIRPQSARN